MYIAEGQGQTTQGDKLLMSTETSCYFGHLLKFKKKNLFEVWFYTVFFFFFFHEFIHLYSPGAGADNPLGTKFLCQQEHLVTSFICCKFKKKCLWSLILYKFFHDLIHVYSPGAGADTPRGQNFDVNRKVLSLTHLLQVSKKSLWSLILYNFFHDLIHVKWQMRHGYQVSLYSKRRDG